MGFLTQPQQLLVHDQSCFICNFKPTFMGFYFSLFYSVYCPYGAGGEGQALLTLGKCPATEFPH